MIRNGNKIFGEANDPNTVLANGELKANQYVVGSGNKGVKQYDAGIKKLMINGCKTCFLRCLPSLQAHQS